MKRVITITMDIDESNYKGEISSEVTEDGKPKTEWNAVQGISTALAMVEQAEMLLRELNDYTIDQMRKMKEEQQ